MSLAQKLAAAYPTAEWTLSGDTYAGLIWIGPGTKPTAAQVAALSDPAAAAPDGPTLGDWRVALVLWPKADGSGSRLDDVLARVQALKAAGSPLAGVVVERLEYSNNVYRAQLLAFKDAVGFSAGEIEESLWRAQRVGMGDLSGVWPLP